MKTIILAIADGKAQQIINAIPGLELKPIEYPYCQRRLVYSRQGKEIVLLINPLVQNVTLPWSSAGNNNNWDIIQLTADPGSGLLPEGSNDSGEMWITRAFRKLTKLAQENPTYLRGPWTIKKLRTLYPDKAAELLTNEDDNSRVCLLAGSTMEAAEEFEYEPTQQEIDDDTDIVLSAVEVVGEIRRIR